MAGVIGVSAWMAARLADPNTFPVRAVHIDGAFQHLSLEDVERTISGQLQGSFFTVRVNTLKAALLNNQWIEDVSVARVWPDRLQVVVREQHPVARWGDSALLNDKGVLFEPADQTGVGDLVRLRGPGGSEIYVLARLREIERLLAVHRQRVKWLSLSSRGAWSFGIVDGPTVVLGRTDLDFRLRRFAEGFEAIFGRRIGGLERVDLRYTNGFAVRGQVQLVLQQG